MDELRTINPETMSMLVLTGDLSRLTNPQKADYYIYRCQQAGLDPAAKPFDYLTLNGKQVLYANAGCSQQLTAIHKLSHQVTNRELVDGIYCVFVRVTGSDGRSTENMGAVPVENLKGEAKANAMLKATTKAIRRSVLAHCGLGMLDESEVETIPGARTEVVTLPTLEAAEPEDTTWTEDDLANIQASCDVMYDLLQVIGMPETEAQLKCDYYLQMKDKVAVEKVTNRMATAIAAIEAKAKKKLAEA
jgi:hypothetical protein